MIVLKARYHTISGFFIYLAFILYRDCSVKRILWTYST